MKSKLLDASLETVHIGKYGACGHSALHHVVKDQSPELELADMDRLALIALVMRSILIFATLPIQVSQAGKTGVLVPPPVV